MLISSSFSANFVSMVNLRLTKSKFRVLSSICREIAQVLFGGFIGGVVVLSLDFWKMVVLILELGFAIGFWYLSLYFGERGKV